MEIGGVEGIFARDSTDGGRSGGRRGAGGSCICIFSLVGPPVDDLLVVADVAQQIADAEQWASDPTHLLSPSLCFLLYPLNNKIRPVFAGLGHEWVDPPDPFVKLEPLKFMCSKWT